MQNFSFSITQDEVSKIQNITLEGALLGLNAMTFGKTLQALINASEVPATIDAQKLNRIDLTGINVLVQAWKQATTNRKSLQFIIGGSENVSQLLHLTKFDTILPILF